MQVEQLLELVKALSSNKSDMLSPGNRVFIRTITMYHVGEIDAIDESFIRLKSASWVASTGRFNEALETGSLVEVERFPDPVLVSQAAIVDVTKWRHSLPVETC